MNQNLLNSRGWQMRSYELLPLLGLKRSIPPDFETVKEIQGLQVYVTKQRVKGRRHHRVFVQCPYCNKLIPAGRMTQHLKIHRSRT